MPAASLEEGRDAIRELVARFAANEAHYMSPEFDEASTREQFINAFFDALGWDVLDTAGLGPDREVLFHVRLADDREVAGEATWDADLSEEELAAREPVAQVPDYVFRLDAATRFFVEAKRAGRTITARAPAFQVKSYAWSQRVRVGVLTSFRQLRVFQCLTRPRYEDPGAGLLEGFDLSYTEYEAHWDQIWALLSRDAVAAGSIDRTGQAPRGALRVDEAFLVELTEWRERLAQDLLDRNGDLNHWELAEATQRILDRLVFLRVCEDRTVEQGVVLRPYARRRDAYRHLCAEFRRLDDVYNGALFAEHFSERLELSDGVIQRLIERLYFPFSPYRFDVIDVDVLGAVYERFLGKEISVDGRGLVQLEDKPEVRHAGGVYYTPRWVVSEIVKGCLDPILEGRTPRTAAGLRIVDPACGSGSFLLGALDYLIRWYENYYASNPAVDVGMHYLAHDGSTRLTSDAKAEIVRRSLFGVDIDPQAVEVAQMSLYLKILEAETDATLHQHMRLFPGPYLPSLSENVRSGNSLLGSADVPRRLLFDEELRRRINPFDWRDAERGFGLTFEERGGFDAVIGNPPYTRVQVLRQMRREEADLYERKFQTAEGGYDIATLFVEQGLSLLRPPRGRDRGGRLGYIISRTFCETEAASPLRQRLSEGRHAESITDFGSGMVFENVGAYTLLLRATAAGQADLTLTRVPPPPDGDALSRAKTSDALTAQLGPGELGGPEPWPLTLPRETAILQRLGATHPSLREVSGNHIFQGVVTGADAVFRCDDVGSHPEDPQLRLVRPHLHEGDTPLAMELDALRPVVAGSNDLHRFRWKPASQWVLLPYERDDPQERYRGLTASSMQELFPNAFAWLASQRETLLNRAPQAANTPWTDENWILYSRRQNLERFAEPKILVPYMVKAACAAYDEEDHYFVNVASGGYGVGASETFELQRVYVAALLNSELLSWALKKFSRAWRGDYFGARAGALHRLPVAEADEEERQLVVEAFRDCSQAAAALDTARTDHDRRATEELYEGAVAEFDARVFALYDIDDRDLEVIRSV